MLMQIPLWYFIFTAARNFHRVNSTFKIVKIVCFAEWVMIVNSCLKQTYYTKVREVNSLDSSHMAQAG